MRSLPAILLVACTGGEPVVNGPRPAAHLLDVEAFVLSTTDPLDHGDVDCPVAAWTLEGATLEIDTGSCAMAVFEQPLLADVRPTEQLELVFWHNELVAEDDAEAHLALLIDGLVIYENDIPIPSEPEAYTERFDGVEASAGALLQLHLHNHGANSYNVLHLERLGSE